MSKLIDFYLGEGTDNADRTLNDVWQLSYSALEAMDDQWIFPTKNKEDVILTMEDIQLFKSNPKLKENLIISFEKMLSFFGLRLSLEEHTLMVRKGLNYNERKHVLFEGGLNHNYLRVTKILNCLNNLGLREHALAFFNFLVQQNKLFTKSCFQHWEQEMWGNIDQKRLEKDKAIGERLRELESHLNRNPNEEDELQKLHYKYYVEHEDVRLFWKIKNKGVK